VMEEDKNYYKTETLVTHKSSNNKYRSVEKRRTIFDHYKN